MWQHLLRNWAYSQAKQHVQKAAVDAVRQRSSGEESAEAEGDDQPRDLRADVVVIAASDSEIGGLEDQLANAISVRGDGFRAKLGETHGRRLLIASVDRFKRPTTEVVRAIIHGHQPRFVIAAGFASGLNERLKRGQIFVATRLLDDAGGRVALDMQMEESADPPAIRVGTLLSSERPRNRIEQKRVLAAEFAADAVDRHAMATAVACQQEQTPLLAVHVTSDALSDDLPQDIRAFLQQESTAGKLGAVTGAMMNRLSSVKDLWQLKEDSLIAADTLGKFLAGMIEQLPAAERHDEP